MRLVTWAPIAAMCVIVRPGFGQQLPAPEVGLEARVTPICAGPGSRAGTRCADVYGKLAGLTVDSVSLRGFDGTTRRLAWSQQQALSVSRHSTGHAGTGLLVGLAAGAVVSVISLGTCKDGGDDPGLCGGLRFVTISGSALLGLLVGAFVRTPNWEPAAIPGR